MGDERMVSQRIGSEAHISSAGWHRIQQADSVRKPRPLQAITSNSLGSTRSSQQLEEGSGGLQWQSRTLASTQTGAGKRCRGTG